MLVAGEAWWHGKWVPSCEQCAKRLGAVWHETIRNGTCDGCGNRMTTVWERHD